MFVAVQALTCGFHPNQTGGLEWNVGVKNPHRIAATTHASDDGIGLQTVCRAGQVQGAHHVGHLLEAFVADDALEVPHHHGVGMGASHRADDVEGVFHIRHPVAHGLVQGIFQRLAAAFDRNHGRAQQFHAIDIGALAFDIFRAHVDHTLQPVTGADGGRRHAMLPCACFGNDTRLAHALGKHGLPDHVVDFVSAGMVQIFAFQENLCAPLLLARAGSVVDGRRAAHEMRQLVAKLG